MAGTVMNKSLVIGIDFGTTFSGVAWAIVDDQKNVQVISTWPGAGNKSSVKVPTLMAFLEGRFLWGWQASALSKEPIRGVKLLFDESQSHRYNPSLKAKKKLDAMKKSPVDVASQYLEQVLLHTQDILERRLGSATKDMSKKYVLTVPAVWSDKAKDNTLKTAISGGIPEHQLALLSEPEAAALYTLRAIQPNTIKKNDTFLVCDAGGGTVDLISYRVHDLSPLSLKEVVEGAGGICGSMILDENFERFLENLVGFEAFELLSERARDGAFRYWQDTIKIQFAGTDVEDGFDDVGWELPLVGAADNSLIGLEGGYLQLNKSQIQGVFDPVVQDVLGLVQAQVRKIKVTGLTLQAILLVGGFGGCEYLYRRLCRAHPRIKVMQPPDAWQAIACGAVHRGLEGNKVTNRLARSHYGAACRRPYNPEVHIRSEAYWCKLEEQWMVNNLMSWFIFKGSSISENQPIRKNFYRLELCEDEKSLVFRSSLYFSIAEAAPCKMSNNVSKLCELCVDLTAVPKRLFEKRTNSNGISYYDISYDLVIIPTSGYMYFQLEFNGTTYGKVQAEYY